MYRLASLLALLFLAVIPHVLFAVEAEPQIFSADPKTVAATKRAILAGDKQFEAALKTLLTDAEESMQVGTVSVVHKPTAPASGDMHDYMSLAPYWFPDPKKPNGLPFYRRDGEVNPEREKFDQPRFEIMSANAATLAQAYYFTGDEKYAAKAAELLRVWFFDEATRMNPNLRYAQVVRGRESELKASGIIESDRLRRVIDADGYLAGSKSWTTDDHAKLQEWMKQFVKWIVESDMGQLEARAANNHGTWYAAQVATMALYIGDEALARQMVEGGKERIATQIEPDGSQPHELARTKAFDYVRFNILGFMQLSQIGQRVGVDLWNYKTEDGRSLRQAIDWFTPYMTGEKEWTHPQITKAKVSDGFLILRRAAIVYNEPTYEEQALKVPGGEPEANRSNLLFPKPKF